VLKLSHRVYSDLSDELRSIWHSVYAEDSSATYFQSWANNERCIFVNNIENFSIYVVLNNSVPVAIMPLENINKSVFKIGRLIGADFNDINDLLISDGNAGIVCNYISKISLDLDLIIFNNVSSLSWGAIAHKYMPIVCDETVRLFFDSNKSGGLRKKVKQDIERQIRRLSKFGELEYRQISMEEYATFLDDLIYHKRRRYAVTKVRDTLSRPNSDRHLRSLRQFNEDLSCSVLTLDTKFLAGSIGFKSRKVYHYYMPSFNHDFAVYSPSKVHLYFETKYQLEENLVEHFDFTVGSERYKQDWINSMEPIYSVSLPRTLKGLVLASLMRVRREIFSSQIVVRLKLLVR